ncbi:hypothetical protein FNW02_28230 [Komarekiella sp. 'clone 1']|uniref:Uncharacterized protein n=1 Tax=Komarekiella delphini-convector SJRDD-AB1 TaxID=2593771 RepID=A0AA40VTW8_9NOST|nr:hypothetical protein [Komarekiella delphini-convector]MBD6619602.1 hypothetical protein [Komarekiella delphini-convector SJRDD-AB1]
MRVVLLAFSVISVTGSRVKIVSIFEQLRQVEVTESWLSRIYALVGLPIGSNILQEISTVGYTADP